MKRCPSCAASTVLLLFLILLMPAPGYGQNPVPDEMTLNSVVGNSGGAPVYLSLRASNSIDIAAFSTGILVDPGALSVDAIIYSGPIDAAFADGNLGSGGANFGVLFSDDLSNVLPAGINRTLLQIGISLSPSAQPGLHPVALGTFGQPPVGPEYATATGGTIIPEVNDGGIAIIGDAAPGNQSNVIGVAVADAASPNLLFHTVDPAGNIVSTEVLNASGGELEVIAVGTDGNGNRVVLAEETSGGITSGRLFIGANAQMSTTTSVDIGPRPSFATLTVGIDGACFAGDGEGDLTAVAADGLLLYGEGGLLGGHIGFDPGPIGATALATGGDSLWVCAGDHLMRLTGPGNVAVDSDLGPGSLPSALAALEDGTVIVALRGAGAIEHRAADGSLICAYDLGGGAQPAGIVILTGTGDCIQGASYATNTMYEIDRTTGTVTSFPIVSGGNGMTVDAAGNTWVSAASAAGGGTLTAYDATGAVVGGLDFPEAPFVTGEASGLPFALIHERDGDEDGDGYNNGSECDASSNPYDPLDDPTSVDNTFVPAVTTLGALIVGDVAGGGFQVVLNWTWESPLDPNPDNYLVTRITDGDPDHHQVEVAGTELGWLDPDPPNGSHTYLVVANLGGNASDERETGAVIGAGQPSPPAPIAPEGVPNPEPFDISGVPSGGNLMGTGTAKYYATDPANGLIYKLDENLEVLGFIPSPYAEGVPLTGIAYRPGGDGGNGSLMVGNGLSGVQTVWKEIDLTGALIADYPLTEPGSPILGAHSGKTGGMAYCEETDMFYGIGPDGCQVLGMAGDSGGELDGDQSGTHPSAGASQSGISVKGCGGTPFGAVTVLYLTSSDGNGGLEVIEVTIGGGSVTPTSAPPISLAGINNPAGVFYDGGYITVISSSDASAQTVQVTASFIRGDANLDGGVDIGDAITVLSHLFVQESDSTCMESFNANNDVAVDIADAIYVVQFLFGADPPGPPPPAPFPEAGPDPDPGDISCE